MERNWRLRRQTFKQAVLVSRSNEGERSEPEIGAGDEPRTRYLNLGKVALYQVSYSRTNCEFYVSTTASACGAASATTERTSCEYSLTRRSD